MSKEKLFVLNMLKEGKINEEEALRLLEAMGENFDTSSEDLGAEEKFKELEGSLSEKISKFVETIASKTSEALQNVNLDDLSFDDFTFAPGSRYKSRTDRSKSLEITEVESPSLKVNSENGNILLNVWDNTFIEVRASVSYDEKLVDPSEDFFTMENHEGEIVIEVAKLTSARNAFDIHFEINIPRRQYKRINISSVNGHIELGPVEAEELNVSTSNGRINGTGFEVDRADLSGTNSRVDLFDVLGKDLRVNVKNGKVSASSIGVEDIDINTTNGSINIRDILADTKRIHGASTNGSIRFYIGSYLRGVKVELEKLNAYSPKVKLSERFASVVQGNGELTAYSEGFDEEAEGNLIISASTINGSLRVE